MSWTNEKVQEAAGKIVERASRDAEFRKLVLADPYAAIKEVTGLEVPREFKLQVVDGSGYHATVVLPEARGAEDELTDTDLEMVSGGSKEAVESVFKSIGNAIETGVRTYVDMQVDAIKAGTNVIVKTIDSL